MKRRRRAVLDRAVRVEEPARRAEEGNESRHRLAPPGEMERLRLDEGAADRLGGAGGREDRTEVLGVRRSPRIAQGSEQRRDVLDARERQPPVTRSEVPHFGSLGEELAHRGLLEGRGEVQDCACARGSAGEGSDEPEDERELERVELPLAAG